MSTFLIYLLGVIITLITVKVLNKYSQDPAPLEAIILLGVFSWIGLFVYLMILIVFYIQRKIDENDIEEILNSFFNTNR